MSDDIPVNITSGYGAHSKQGYVSWQMADRKPIQLTSDDARHIAGLLWDAAAAADVDHFLMSWAQESLSVSEMQAGHLMADFRAWRAARSEERVEIE